MGHSMYCQSVANHYMWVLAIVIGGIAIAVVSYCVGLSVGREWGDDEGFDRGWNARLYDPHGDDTRK